MFELLIPLEPLQTEAASELEELGFTVLHGALSAGRMEALTSTYNACVSSAASGEVRIGSTTTRVDDFVNRGEEFDALYVYPPLLDACCRVIGPAFKLSSLHARTLHPRTPPQGLHVDVRRGCRDWPLVGFILMVDAFTPDNGATRFVPRSHQWPNAPGEDSAELSISTPEVLACGEAGSLIVFNGSAWHGHSANTTDRPRRSLQGAFIPRGGRAATDFAGRMRAETRARLGPVARYVLGV